MNAVLDKSISITYDGNEPVSPTAVGPIPVISPEHPAEDDSADAGDSKWSRVEEYPFTSQSAEPFSGAFLAALFDLEQSSEAREEDLSKPRLTSLPNVFDTSKRLYIHPMSVDVHSTWNKIEKHHAWFEAHQSAEPFSGAFLAALFDLEQSSEAREEDLSKPRLTSLPNVFDTSKRLYIHPMSVDVHSTWNKIEKHHAWFEAHQSAEPFSGAFLATLFDLEQIDDDARAKDLPDLLANALRDLQEINDEADEEGMLPPSELAIANADRLIREIYNILPCQYLVELLPDGVIAITIPGEFRCSVMLLCESEGGALCSVNMNGKYRSKRYPQANQLQDIFLREALSELGRE